MGGLEIPGGGAYSANGVLVDPMKKTTAKKKNRNCIIYATLFSVLSVIIFGCSVGIYVCKRNHQMGKDIMAAPAPAPATDSTMISSTSSASSSSDIENESIESTSTTDTTVTKPNIDEDTDADGEIRGHPVAGVKDGELDEL